MSSVIAKKYVNALISSLDDKALLSTLESLKTVVPAFSNKKFNDILSSHNITSNQREAFFLSLFKNPDKKLTNFLKILNVNGRLSEIPSITHELSKQVSLKNNEYEGLLISNFKVPAKDIKEIEENISKKLGATIKLTNKVSENSGIKVEVESLGVEVSFSSDRLKSQMTEHILKTL